MRAKLQFPLMDVRELVVKTISASNHSVTFGQRFSNSIAKQGIEREKGRYLKDEEIDKRKVVPALWLIKEVGVFLSSSAVGGVKKDDGKKLVVFANGLGPKASSETLRKATCEEDFCEPIVITDDLKKMVLEESGTHFIIDWRRKSFSLSVEKID